MEDKQVTYEKMLGGRLYVCTSALGEDQAKYMELLYEYNSTRPSEGERRQALLKEMFAEIGEGCYIEPPLHANWAGRYVHFGKCVYANFNLTMVDDCDIFVGDNVMFGPNVTLAVAGHPIAPELRDLTYQYNMPIHIGNHAWIGAGAIILPGVTIGDNVVIGAGSVVTRDIPANSIAVGNPCRVIREISARDYEYYWRDRKIEPEELKILGQKQED